MAGHHLLSGRLVPVAHAGFIVEKDALGTVSGCMISVQNLFLAVFAVLIGQLQDWAKDKHPGVFQYTLPIMIFIFCAFLSLVLTLILLLLDQRQGGKLNASAQERSRCSLMHFLVFLPLLLLSRSLAPSLDVVLGAAIFEPWRPISVEDLPS